MPDSNDLNQPGHSNPNSTGPETRSAVVLVVDQLSAWLLGPYGNTWFDSVNFNRLAGSSMLFDMCVTDTPDLERAYRGLWFGGPAMDGNADSFYENRRHLAEELDDYGVRTILASDRPTLSGDSCYGHAVNDFDFAAAFERTVEFETTEPDGLAGSISNAYLAEYFSQAVQLVSSIDPGDFIWMHCQGLSGPWDAPYSSRQRLADEEDPDPPRFTRLPQRSFDPATEDPDLLLGFQQACVAQVQTLDLMLGVLLDQLPSETLFCLTSTRGIPLGEHSVVGSPETLHQEVTHVPLLIRTPETARNFGARSQRLVQPQILRDIVLQWFASIESGAEASAETEAKAGSGARPSPQADSISSPRADWMNPVDHDSDQQTVFSSLLNEDRQIVASAIQTREWKYIRHQNLDASLTNHAELYVKPDDRWEVNNVADRGWADAKQLKHRLQDETKRY